MTFARINPGGWAVGDIYTSAQGNAADSRWPNVLDKTGDVLIGTLTVGGAASIQATAGASIQAQVGAAITSVATGGLTSAVVGGFALGGGTTDWPTFGVASNSPRTRIITAPMMAIDNPISSGNWVLTTSGFAGTPSLVSQANANAAIGLWLPMHNGATLASAAVTIYVPGAHGGGAPGTPPSFNIWRCVPGVSQTSLYAAPVPAFTSPPSGSAWHNGGVAFQFGGSTPTINTGAVNVINTASYLYFMVLTDESGANAAVSNNYSAITLTFNNIPNMAFP
jgi:hypothetical protein